jgi:hypothetical protein
MREWKAVIAVMTVLASASPGFAGELVTPPLSAPQPNPSNFIQCAATNLDVQPLNVTIEILDRFGMTIEGPTATLLNPLARFESLKSFCAGGGPVYDDHPARVMGSRIGQRGYARALQFFEPAASEPVTPARQVVTRPSASRNRTPRERSRRRGSTAPE